MLPLRKATHELYVVLCPTTRSNRCHSARALRREGWTARRFHCGEYQRHARYAKPDASARTVALPATRFQLCGNKMLVERNLKALQLRASTDVWKHRHGRWNGYGYCRNSDLHHMVRTLVSGLVVHGGTSPESRARARAHPRTAMEDNDWHAFAARMDPHAQTARVLVEPCSRSLPGRVASAA